MNSIKLHFESPRVCRRLIFFVLMCVGLCPRVAMAENDDNSGSASFEYGEKDVKISIEQDQRTYKIGLYFFEPAVQEKSISSENPISIHRFLFAQRTESNWDWWYAVQFEESDRSECVFKYTGISKPTDLQSDLGKLFKFDPEFKFDDRFGLAQKKIKAFFEKKFNIKQDNNPNMNNAKDQGESIEDIISQFFGKCDSIEQSESYFKREPPPETDTSHSAKSDTESNRLPIGSLTRSVNITNGSTSAGSEKIILSGSGQHETQSGEITREIVKRVEKLLNESNLYGLYSLLKEYSAELRMIVRLIIVLLMVLMVLMLAGGFLLYRKVARRFDEKMEGYHADTQPQISDDMHNFEKQQKTTLTVVCAIHEELKKQKKASIGNDERMALNYQNTDAEQANTLSEKLTAHIEQQFQDQSEESIARGKEYNDKLEKLRLDMQTQLKDAKAGQEQAMESLLPAIQRTHQQFKSFIRQNEQFEQLRLDYEDEKSNRLDIQKQLEDAKADQKQERERFDDFKKNSVRIYQQGGLKLSDEESENLTSERLAELGSWYRKNPTVQQYGLAINELKNSLGDPALTDESFFKAVGLNVLKGRLNQIESFLEFYQSDDLSKFLRGHWRENIQLIFRACLLLESYFQLGKKPVLFDLQLARDAAEKLLWEHGLIPDDFQLPVPSHELERKFEVTVHGDIPVDLAAHAGFKDKVQALRRSGAHKVVCYVKRWGLSARADSPYTHDLPGTVLKSLERDSVVQGWGD